MLTSVIETMVAEQQSAYASINASPRASPFAWLPDYRSDEEMVALWRAWGWRVLGREPVADEDRTAFTMVCRQLLTNWGSVYRPVALLPPLPSSVADSREEVRLLNQCLATGWTLRQHGTPVTAAAVAAAVGVNVALVERLLPRLLSMLDTVLAHAATEGNAVSCGRYCGEDAEMTH